MMHTHPGMTAPRLMHTRWSMGSLVDQEGADSDQKMEDCNLLAQITPAGQSVGQNTESTIGTLLGRRADLS